MDIPIESRTKMLGDAYVALRNGGKSNSSVLPILVSYIRTASDDGIKLAYAFLIKMLYHGYGIALDRAEANRMANDTEINIVPWLLEACKAGETHEAFPYCHYLFSFMFDFGLVVDKDEDIAYYYLEIAARRSYPPAIHTLALRTRGDKEKVTWLIKAAEQNYVPSLRWLSDFYGELATYLPYNRQLMLLSQTDAIKHYTKTLDTQFRNTEEAFLWFEAGAHLGDKDCQRDVAQYYKNGTSFVGKDIRKAILWYEKAVDQGDVMSYLPLSELLMLDTHFISTTDGQTRVVNLLLTAILKASDDELKLQLYIALAEAYFRFTDYSSETQQIQHHEELCLQWLSAALKTIDGEELVHNHKNSKFFFRLACRRNHGAMILAMQRKSIFSLESDIEKVNFIMTIAEDGQPIQQKISVETINTDLTLNCVLELDYNYYNIDRTNFINTLLTNSSHPHYNLEYLTGLKQLRLHLLHGLPMTNKYARTSSTTNLSLNLNPNDHQSTKNILEALIERGDLTYNVKITAEVSIH